MMRVIALGTVLVMALSGCRDDRTRYDAVLVLSGVTVLERRRM